MSDDPRRQRAYLRTRYRTLLAYTALTASAIGLLILAPLVVLPFYPDEAALLWAFAWPGLLLVGLGMLFWVRLRPRASVRLSYAEGALIVTAAWLLAIFFGSFPLLSVLGVGWTPALFESASGWTTTGLSVVDVATAPRIVLLYRSVMQMAGGAGFVIIALSVLAGPSGTGLTGAEGRSELLVPHVQRSAKLVLGIYGSYILVGIVALRLAGMPWFDAVNHALCALSTGGFSTRPASIGHWDSPAIELVTIALMLLGALNFLTAWLFLRGNWRTALRSGEVRLEAVLAPLGALILLLGTTLSLYATLGKSVRVALFEAIAALSTTGYTTVSYASWNSLGLFVLLVFMLIGGGAGSTAGAIKLQRIHQLAHGIAWELRRPFLPAGVVSAPILWEGGERRLLSDTLVRQAAVFAAAYLVVLAAGSMVLSSYGYSLQESLFEFASALGTVGLSVGVTALDAPRGVLWAEMAGMVFGRLELFAVVTGAGKLLIDGRDILRKS